MNHPLSDPPTLTRADLERLEAHRGLFGPAIDGGPGSFVRMGTAWLRLDDFDKLLAAATFGMTLHPKGSVLE